MILFNDNQKVLAEGQELVEKFFSAQDLEEHDLDPGDDLETIARTLGLTLWNESVWLRCSKGSRGSWEALPLGTAPDSDYENSDDGYEYRKINSEVLI